MLLSLKVCVPRGLSVALGSFAAVVDGSYSDRTLGIPRSDLNRGPETVGGVTCDEEKGLLNHHMN